jgi:hypothetical protein
VPSQISYRYLFPGTEPTTSELSTAELISIQQVEDIEVMTRFAVGDVVQRSPRFVTPLEPELLRSERLPEPFPGSLDELRGAYDLFDLGLGAVSPYVVFSDHLLQGHLLLHAGDHVIGDFLLTGGEGGASRASEEPLPEGWPFAHEVSGGSFLSLVRGEVDLTALVGKAHLPMDYSPECVGGLSSEAELRVYAVLRSSASERVRRALA